MVKVDVKNIAVDDVDKETNRKRKSGGGRKPSKPDYNSKVLLREQIEATVAIYSSDNHSSLQAIADKLDLNPIKQEAFFMKLLSFSKAHAIIFS